MKRWKLFRRVAVLTLAIALAPALASAAHADAVTDWNAIMQATVAAPPTNPNFQTRWGAIVQLAVFEAVNAIVGDYEPYLGDHRRAGLGLAGRRGHCRRPSHPGDPAPGQRRGPRRLAGRRRSRRSRTARRRRPASHVGEDAAAAMLLLRADDGWDAVVPYTPGTDPGDWQPTPPALAPAFLPGWGQVTPFGLREGSQFRLPPPPALHTGKYANDYNEVKLLGRIDSPFRPQDRTDVARFYAAASPVQVWNSAARQVSAAQGKTLSENARIFALLAMAMGDASIAVWDTKYHYNFWRPLTAIRSGDIDGNRTDRPGSGLAPADRHPGAPQLRVGPRDRVRRRPRGARAGLRQGRPCHHPDQSRAAGHRPQLHRLGARSPTTSTTPAIYGGIHFRFDQEAGARQGRQVGSYILGNYLRSQDDN